MTSQGVREQQYRDQRAALQDQFGNWAFDENGYLPEAPGRRVGMEAQYATNRYTAARNRESREAAIQLARKFREMAGFQSEEIDEIAAMAEEQRAQHRQPPDQARERRSPEI